MRQGQESQCESETTLPSIEAFVATESLLSLVPQQTSTVYSPSLDTLQSPRNENTFLTRLFRQAASQQQASIANAVHQNSLLHPSTPGDGNWQQLNSVIYASKLIIIFQHVPDKVLYFSWELVLSFLSVNIQKYIDSIDYFCSKHMMRTTSPFFMQYGLFGKKIVTTTGVEHIYHLFRNHQKEYLRTGSSFLEDLVIVLKEIEERKNSLLIPQDSAVKTLSLPGLFSGAQTIAKLPKGHGSRVRDKLRAYQCVCGVFFPTSQAKAGHTHFCSSHKELKRKKIAWMQSLNIVEDKTVKTSNGVIVYMCDCGQQFLSSQAKAGHCHFCSVHKQRKSESRKRSKNLEEILNPDVPNKKPRIEKESIGEKESIEEKDAICTSD